MTIVKSGLNSTLISDFKLSSDIEHKCISHKCMCHKFLPSRKCLAQAGTNYLHIPANSMAFPPFKMSCSMDRTAKN